MDIDHIGYAVKRLDRAVRSFEALGFSFEDVIDDTDRNIKIQFGENQGYRIELVTPLDKSKGSPVDAFLSKVGPTPYHICYISADLDAEIENLKKQGFKTMIEPKKAVAFDGKRVVFMMDLGQGLMEIVEA